MVKNLINNKKNLRLSFSDEGFTLIELVAVVSILSILGSMGIGNITRWIKLSKIDQATALLSNSLVECLESTRSGIDPASIGPPADVIDNNRLETSGYKIKDSKDKCSQFFITPIDSDEKFLFEMGYQITVDNQVTKIATPADNQSSLSRCKRWAGPNCGASEEQKKKWEEERLLAERKKKCEDDYSAWLSDAPPPGRTGSSNSWDSTKKTCTRQKWVCDGTELAGGQEALDKCIDDKQGAECTKNVNDFKNATPPTDGIIENVPSCPAGNKYYFCQGDKMNNEDEMKVCRDKAFSDKCALIYSEKAKTGYSGSWGPKPKDEYGNAIQGPPPCGDIAYMCGGNFTYDEDAYKQYDCYNPGGGGGGDGGGGDDKLSKCMAQMNPNHVKKIKVFCKDGSGIGTPGAFPGFAYCPAFDQCMGN